MTTADIITVVVFLATVLVGLAIFVLRDAVKNSPQHRIRARLHHAIGASRHAGRQKVLAELQRAQAEARRRRRREAMGTLGYYLNRLDTVGNGRGVFVVVLVMAVTMFAVTVGITLGLLPREWWALPVFLLGFPALAGMFTYGKLVDRFRHGFLSQLPDAMDMIVRASQAGVPVGRSIRNIGDHFSAPLGPEFRRIGDSLLLGNDLQDVLDEAVLRVELPDFAFFAVCLSLQRDTGGSLVEALENLSGVIRARRDLSLKAKALTAEGRLSGGILAALPFVITGTLYLSSPDYVRVLFETDTGQTLLGVAAIMLVVGVVSIKKIANMEL